MKKIKIICFAAFLTAFAACQKEGFLDSKTTGILDSEVTFADSANTMDFLAGLYIDLGYNFNIDNGHNIIDYSKHADEAEGRYPALGNYDKIFTQGTFATAFYQQPANQWTLHYNNIRNANIFLANVDKSPLSVNKKNRVKAEARFLRAMHYHFLTRMFGGVPIVSDQVFTPFDDGSLVRSSYEDCVNYMVSELDASAAVLPTAFSGLDYGRITRGACLALKSRVLLFAASPLYNGGSTANNPDLVKATAYPSFDQSRWEKARLAAKAVIDLGLYSLNTDNTTPWGGSSAGRGYGFYKVFITRQNNEFILPLPLPTGRQIERSVLPRSRGGVNYYYYPTQELVDKFPTINGKPITTDLKSPTNSQGYDAANPYANRDPRLSATVIYNGSLYYLNATRVLAPVDTYFGAPNDGIADLISNNTTTLTGYYARKMCDELATIAGGNNVDRSLPIIRYGETLLNYAEASNEVGNTADALNALKDLRIRAGISAGTDNSYGLPSTNVLKNDLRTLIQNERAIELAFEQHRLWDIRRWKIGAELDGKFVHGMRITKTGNNFSYARIDIRTRYFKDIYYYFPIPIDDVTLNPKLLQNPGY